MQNARFIQGLRLLTICVLALLLIRCRKQAATAVQPVPQYHWQLAFEDDFSSNAVDTTMWSTYYSAGYNGNGLRRPSAFSVQNGALVVTASMQNGVLVSGGMSNNTNFLYGKFLFRVRADADSTQATSAVVLTWPQSENWPVDGENDIFETGNSSSRNPFYTNIHYSAANMQYSFQQNADGKQWHTMEMDWTPTAITIFRDSTLIGTVTDPAAIIHVPHHLCIQLDAYKPVVPAPVRMYVDWVKIYKMVH